MKPIALVTDSSACLPKALVSKLNIAVVPQWVHTPDGSFPDGEIDPAEIWERLARGERITTTPPAVGDFLRVFQRLAPQVETILVIPVASAFSSTYSTARVAVDQGGLSNVQVVNSGTALGGLGLTVLAAARATQAGGESGEVLHAAKEVSLSVHLFAVLNTLEYALRSGRVPSLARLARSLKVFPLLELRDSRVHVRTMARTMRKALAEMRRQLPLDPPRRVLFLVHTGDEAERAAWMAQEQAWQASAAFYVGEPAASVCTHFGPGGVSLAVLPA